MYISIVDEKDLNMRIGNSITCEKGYRAMGKLTRGE